MATKNNLDTSEGLLKETFRDTQLVFINSYVNSLLETEDFSKFSKYTKALVIEYFRAFLNRLICYLRLYIYNSKEDELEDFYNSFMILISSQLAKIKNILLSKNLLNDLMSDNALKNKLEDFFEEHENRAEFKKAQDGYIDIKHDFETIIDLAESFRTSGEQMLDKSEKLMKMYLQYKEAIFKGMGFDVVLEYYSIDNFNFLYRDARLHDDTERAKYEAIAMNAALKAAMPGFDGDISMFKKIAEKD